MTGKREHYFTIHKFLLTGREMWMEMKSSLRTRRGKGGLVLFFLGLLWGIYTSIQDRNGREDFSMVCMAALWCTMGLAVMVNLQNHKLMYLLPLNRKEFAMAQIRKMLWVMVGIWCVFLVCQAFVFTSVESLCMNMVCKAFPVGISLSSYQITSVKPVRESELIGSGMYHLSYFAIVLNIVAACINGMWVVDSWSWYQFILPILNYGIGISASVYFYRKIAYTQLYYDEICAG